MAGGAGTDGRLWLDGGAGADGRLAVVQMAGCVQMAGYGADGRLCADGGAGADGRLWQAVSRRQMAGDCVQMAGDGADGGARWRCKCMRIAVCGLSLLGGQCRHGGAC